MRSGTKVRRESGRGRVGGLGVVRFQGEQWLSGGQGTVAWRKMKYLITSSGRERKQMCRPEVAGGSPARESGKVVHQTEICRSLRPSEVFDRTRLLSRRCPLELMLPPSPRRVHSSCAPPAATHSDDEDKRLNLIPGILKLISPVLRAHPVPQPVPPPRREGLSLQRSD